jgi:CBS domain containing-hemolysin-like protein
MGLVEFLVIAGLVFINGFFVAAEFALVSVRKSRIDQLANEGSGRARVVQRALTHLDTYIAATQLGITMASLGLGFIGEPAIATLLEPLFARIPFLPHEGAVITSHTVAFIVAFSIATALHIVFGELAPKSVALQRADVTALWVTAPLNLFLTIFRPFIVALNGIGNGVVRLIGLEPAGEHGSVHSVEELELLVHSSREAGLLEEQQERMVAGVFDFGERQASQAMTPRTEFEAVPVTIGLPELAERAADGRYSRLPVYEGDLDHVVGVVHAKDVLRAMRRALGPGEPFDIRALVREVPVVPESMPLDALMAEMRSRKTHVAVVVDEFGGTAGLVTLEDLLEEIVGDVQDEFDPTREPIETLGDGTVVIDGLLGVEEADERFSLGIEEPFYDTLGGYVFGQLGRAPAVGDEVSLRDGRQLRVAEVDGRRVARVLLLPRSATDGGSRAAHDGAPEPILRSSAATGRDR